MPSASGLTLEWYKFVLRTRLSNPAKQYLVHIFHLSYSLLTVVSGLSSFKNFKNRATVCGEIAYCLLGCFFDHPLCSSQFFNYWFIIVYCIYFLAFTLEKNTVSDFYPLT